MSSICEATYIVGRAENEVKRIPENRCATLWLFTLTIFLWRKYYDDQRSKQNKKQGGSICDET